MVIAMAAVVFPGSAIPAAAAETSPTSVYTVSVSTDSSSVKSGGTVRISLDITSSDSSVATFNAADLKLTYDADNFTFDLQQSSVPDFDAEAENGVLILRRLGEDAALKDGAELSLAFTAGNSPVDACAFSLLSARIDRAANAEADAPEAEVEHSPAVVSIQPSAPVFKTNALVLSGQIGVIFYMQLPDMDGVDYEDSYMTFNVHGTEKTDPFDAEDMSPSGYYGFTCYVNSISMAEDITAVFHYGDGQTVEREEPYSVAKYVEAFETKKSEFDSKTATLIESMADYGHYVQFFLDDVRSWTLGEDYAPMNWYFTENYDYEAIKNAVQDCRIVRDLGTSEPDLEKITYALCLDAETSIYVYLKPADGYSGMVRVTENGQDVNTEVLSDGRYRADVFNISAHRLGDTHDLKIETDSGTAKVKVSALSYVDSVLNADAYADDARAKDAMAAFYKYNEAAVAFKAQA